MKLTELEKNKYAKVVAVRGGGPLRQRLLDMGIARGVLIRMVRYAPLNDPMQIHVKGTNLAIRCAEAELVEVELVPENTQKKRRIEASDK